MIEVDDSRQSREQVSKLIHSYGGVLTKDMHLVITVKAESEQVVISITPFPFLNRTAYKLEQSVPVVEEVGDLPQN